MYYNEEQDLLLLSVRELVSTARRKIAAALQADENEPHFDNISDAFLNKLIPDRRKEYFSLPFKSDMHSFLVTCSAEKAGNNQITLIFTTDTNPQRPKKELTLQARGEGFVTALAYMKMQSVHTVTIEYIYINPQTEQSFTVNEQITEKKALLFFDKCRTVISVYAVPEIERVKLRLPTMRNLRFPYKNIREGQSEFIHTAYRTISKSGVMLASAPTGTGKTVSALYPAVRALGDGKCSKVFYLTPKTTTARAAAECLAEMEREGALIRGVIISSKERACKNRLVCRESRGACENSENKRIADATLSLYSKALTVADIDDIYSVAKEYMVCPHELSLAYSELADVIICDVNYLFDPKSYIRRHFDEPKDYALLIDEAHNLPDRAREMYSAEITAGELASPEQAELLGEHSAVKNFARVAANSFLEALMPYVKEEMREDEKGKMAAAVHLREIPTELYSLFEELLIKTEDEIFKNTHSSDEESNARLALLKDYYYSALYFYNSMLRFDGHYELFLFLSDGELTAKIFCIDPSKEIQKRVELVRSAIFFSATLSPLSYYRYVLGADSTASVIEVDSPFDPSQLAVCIMDKISTRFSEREETLLAVTRAIAATVSAKRGNYMVFSPSFAYSNALSEAFKAKYPKIKVLTQKKNMTAAEKMEFLNQFKQDDESYLIGFCVMGGIYAEGIDLAGDSLIGAVVVGVGIPQLSYEREAISAYYDEKFDEGKAYAYIYPGINRVLQAAGRVIRREEDRGVIVLIDDRFDDPIYKKALPNLWHSMKFISTPKELNEELRTFWSEP